MAATNWARGCPGWYEHVPEAEIERRAKLIMEAKQAVARDLTDAELDAILDPVDCRRTRHRLARGKSFRAIRGSVHSATK